MGRKYDPAGFSAVALDYDETGTAALPSLSFANDSDTGLYNSVANTLDVTAGGVQAASITATQILANVGAAATPGITFIGDADTGIYHSGANLVDIAAGGLQAAEFSGTQVLVNNGTAAAPGLTFIGDADTGAYHVAANTLGLAAGGSLVGQVDAAGIASVGDIRLGNVTPGGAAGTRQFVKYVTAIADNTATDIVTVTVPNVTAAARVVVSVVSALGAGGAIGAGEATGATTRVIAVNRFLGANAVATAATATGAISSVSAGGATITTTLGVSSITGAVGVTNTFTVQVTIAKGSGSSANHTCMVIVDVQNALAGGVTAA